MSQNVPPWLEGLDEEDQEWGAPTEQPKRDVISSATHDAGSIPSRIPKGRFSGSLRGSAQKPTQKRRDPLALLSGNNGSSIREATDSLKMSQSRAVSGASEGSVVQYNSSQQRFKTASPKKTETLEWKRRLVKGEIGYGDQTDLFGATGLENIFAQTRPDESSRKHCGSMSWLHSPANFSLTFSPPLWPTKIDEHPIMGKSGLIFTHDGLSAADREDSAILDESHDGRSLYSEPLTAASLQPLSARDDSTVQGQNQDFNSANSQPEHVSARCDGNRTVSGHTDLDDFSPVFVSKHTTMNGMVEYKALDSHVVKKFRNMTLNLKPDGQTSPECTNPSETDIVAREESRLADSPESESLLAVPDLSLSENLPTGTPPVARLSETVQVRRGGYSRDGSFNLRPLSPSQSSAPMSIAHELDVPPSPPASTSHRYLNEPKSSHDIHTPLGNLHSVPRSRSSGSPLKLFGPHDTFTNNRLLRRMSELNPDLSAARSEDTNEVSRVQQQASSTTFNERIVSGASFGNGALDDQHFEAEINITSASDSDRSNSARSPNADVSRLGSEVPGRSISGNLLAAHDTFKFKRELLGRNVFGSKASHFSGSVKHLQPTVEDASENVVPTTSNSTSQCDPKNAAPKRPRNSPVKAPTPKRRRTLHASELQSEVSGDNRRYHVQLQEVLSNRKRRESRRGDDREIADASVLAQRKLLRPRNPTPSQCHLEQIEAEIKRTAEQFVAQEPEVLEAMMDQLDSSMASDSPPSIQEQANVVANEVAKFKMRVQNASGDHTDRKPSVTTQDFFNEAVMVMRLIREKAGRHNGLGSVAESEQEAIGDALEADRSNLDLSLSLRVSRPPSREGASGWRPRTSQQTDLRIISHLRKFEERNDTDFIAESALQIDEEGREEVVIDEQSNIRIRGPIQIRDRDAEIDPSRPSTQDSQQSSVTSQPTQNFSTSSTGRTLHSRKSDNVGTLAPESVAHLIGEQVGAMTYDKEKQQWVKAKSPHKPQYGSFLEPPSNITSDDDPFKEISDLPVDQNNEEDIRKFSCANQTSAETAQELGSQVTWLGTVHARPNTGNSNRSHHTYSSSDPSRYTALASSQQHTIETRATSWGNEELEQPTVGRLNNERPLGQFETQTDLDFQSRFDRLPKETAKTDHQTVGDHVDADAEEAPQDNIQTTNYAGGLDEDTAVHYETDGLEDLHSPRLRRPPPKLPLVQANSTYPGAARHESLRRKMLTSKFSNIDLMEQSEVSFVAPLPGERMMSVSLSVSRPLSKRQDFGQVTNLQSSPARPDSTFLLSDLPDFTIHEEDHEKPSERALAHRLVQHAAAEADDRFALAVKDLVKTLTDVKEDEPYWEDLRQLDLHGRNLASIYGLERFCESVQEIDLSENKLQYLNGAPSAIRHLVARSNQLSNLTSWGHLVNLQYLDISGNQLHSLDALSCLVHLREVRADDNNITSLDGLMQMDGLLKLRARRNKLRTVDFQQSLLRRLEDLDLADNAITSICNLEALASLRSIQLDNNPIAVSLQLGCELSTLTHLSMKNCGLKSITVREMPHLRNLLLDGNALDTVAGIEALQSLDVLSMRRQLLPDGKSITLLDHHVHARTIKLSENNMPTLRLSNSLLSVQHLELASVGLKELPGDFGLLLPNLTTLNLNFNFLRDIRPLLNIQKLEQLSVCGNKLERLRKTVATLSRLTTLTMVDLRDNHLTQTFYPPQMGMQHESSVVQCRASLAVEDEDGKAERLEAAKYIFVPGNEILDRAHQTRLDGETILRRRVYHLLLGNSCHNLQEVDGLAFDRAGVTAKDKTWERLLELEIVRKSGAVRLKSDEKCSP